MNHPHQQFADHVNRVTHGHDGSSAACVRSCHGLTMIELLMALTITSIIGAAIAAMLFATARGTSDQNDQRDFLMRQKSLDARLSAVLRSSTRVLAGDATYMVLWMGDSRKNDLVNLSELRRIEFDSTNQRIVAYKTVFPQGWSQAQIDAADAGHALSSNFNTLTTNLKTSSYFPAEIWMTGISAASFTYPTATLADVRLVNYQITLTEDTLTQVMIGAGGLRVR